MIRINEFKIHIQMWADETKEVECIKREVFKRYFLKESDVLEFHIRKKSIDARKKREMKFIYAIELQLRNETSFLSKKWGDEIKKVEIKKYKDPFELDSSHMKKTKEIRPVVVGMGPAGLFCGYMLAKAGFCPILLERGGSVEERVHTVETFWREGKLDLDCNVQFGEGGAGTFSDGKLNTLVKDPHGRNRLVLEILVEHGAPKEILYWNKPHIGTDRLREVVKNIREHILSLGGEIFFHTKVTNIETNKKHVIQVQYQTDGEEKELYCNTLVLAIGHSARDTVQMLYKKGMLMTPKAFAMGVRIEHPQIMISQLQYGEQYKKLPPADYKLTHQTTKGRAVYSFCMCPGGFVVNSSSEEGHLVVNGMSNYDRGEKNANSAIVVSIKPEDFVKTSPLDGILFQRKWERLAYQIGNGTIPVQCFGDFRENQETKHFGEITPVTKGQTVCSNLRECLPDYVSEALLETLPVFGQKIQGFDRVDCILSGVETRTSSPIRMERNDNLMSSVEGIYPCGEGAGYAGGITSAAMDGIKVYEAIQKKYHK